MANLHSLRRTSLKCNCCYLPEIYQVAKGLFDAYQSLHNVYNVAKNREIFEETQREVYPKAFNVSAKSLGETRWSCRFLSIDSIY